MTAISECANTDCKYNRNGDCQRYLIRISKDGKCDGYEVKKAEGQSMSNDFYNGMLKFEQQCEKLLVESDLKKETQTYIQIAILDKAQAIIEALEDE